LGGSASALHATEMFPHMGTERPDVGAFTRYLDSTYGQAGGADRLAYELLGTSMAPVLKDLPILYRRTVEDLVRAYLAPALLTFATKTVANNGRPFESTDRVQTMSTPAEFRTWDESENKKREVAAKLGIVGIEKARHEAALAYAAAGRHLPKDPLRFAAARAEYENTVANTKPAWDAILDAAGRAGYGDQHPSRSPSNAYEGDKVARIHPSTTTTVLRPDPLKTSMNELLALQQGDPEGFARTIQQATVDPTPFLTVLLEEHGPRSGAVAEVARAASRDLVKPEQQSILGALARLYGSNPEYAFRAGHDLPSSLANFLAARKDVNLTDDVGRRLGYAGHVILDFGPDRS
jgi:hypothetical protein